MNLTVARLKFNFLVCMTALATFGFSSCQSPNVVSPVMLSGRHDVAIPRIIYQLDSSHTAKLLAQFGTRAASPEILVVSGQQPQHSTVTLDRETAARLELVGGSNGTAWAFLTIASSPRRIFRLQIDAAEMSLALRGLEYDGLFTAQKRPSGGAKIEVFSESATIAKEWTPEPRLDELSERVLTMGEEITSGDLASAGRARITASVPPMPED